MTSIVNRMERVFGLILLAGLLGTVPARGVTYYVAPPPAGDDMRTGLDYWTNAVASISNAVYMARTSAGNLILVSNGLYTLSTPVTITNGTTMRSWNNGAVDPTNTIVKGNGLTRCFNLQHAGAVLNGLLITNGSESSAGGVYLNAGIVTNCTITGNSATGQTTRAGGGGAFIWTAGPPGWLTVG